MRGIVERHGSELLGGIRAITILSEEVAALVPKHRRVILERKRAYLDLVRGTLDELKAAGAGDVVVVVGGVIPPQDYDFLHEHGVAAVFGPGTNIPQAAHHVLDLLRR